MSADFYRPERVPRLKSFASYAAGAGLMIFGAIKFMETPMYQHSTAGSLLLDVIGTAAYAGSIGFPVIAGYIAGENESNGVSFDSQAQRVGSRALYAGLGAASALSWIAVKVLFDNHLVGQ